MILGIGTDIAEVARFQQWSGYSREKLTHIFSDKELEACVMLGKSGQYRSAKLAVRFAAKEAFYKALSSLLVKLGKTDHKFYFLSSCRHIEIVKTTWDIPVFKINWSFFEQVVGDKLSHISTHLSLSDEKLFVVAHVVLSIGKIT